MVRTEHLVLFNSQNIINFEAESTNDKTISSVASDQVQASASLIGGLFHPLIEFLSKIEDYDWENLRGNSNILQFKDKDKTYSINAFKLEGNPFIYILSNDGKKVIKARDFGKILIKLRAFYKDNRSVVKSSNFLEATSLFIKDVMSKLSDELKDDSFEQVDLSKVSGGLIRRDTIAYDGYEYLKSKLSDEFFTVENISKVIGNPEIMSIITRGGLLINSFVLGTPVNPDLIKELVNKLPKELTIDKVSELIKVFLQEIKGNNSNIDELLNVFVMLYNIIANLCQGHGSKEAYILLPHNIVLGVKSF